MANENKFSVAISYHGAIGWIDYDGDTKTATVNLSDAEGKKLAEDYLAEKHTIRQPFDNLLDFRDVEVDPLADVRSFQLALTRLWEANEVHVDWSRPVEFVKEHPTLESTEYIKEKYMKK